MDLIAKLVEKYILLVNKLKDLVLVFLRLNLAYGFYQPAMNKLNNFDDIITWFGSLGIPAPTINAYMAVGTELSGVVLLTLGLATRFISMPLIIVMLVAIKTVHLKNGFACGDNGFEIPFYYILMLLTLLVFGAGKFSVDNIIAKRFRK